jgi:hypothetical protein
VVLPELPERPLEVAELERDLLRRGDRMLDDGRLLEGDVLRSIAAALVVEEVAQDREYPRLEVGARTELMRGRERTHGGIMNEVVRQLPIARQ